MNLRTQIVMLLLAGFPVTGPGTCQDAGLKIPTGAGTFRHHLAFEGQSLIFEASLPLVRLDKELGDQGYLTVDIPGFGRNGHPGLPSLPSSFSLVEVRKGGVSRVTTEVLDSVVLDLEELGLEGLLLPARPPRRKGDPARVPLPDSTVYKTNAWFGAPVVSLEYEGKMRGTHVSTFCFSPVQYQPVSGQLKVYTRVRCRIEVEPAVLGDVLATEAFAGILDRVVRQEDPAGKKAIRAEEPMTLVVVSHPMFRETLQPLLRWKRIKGFNVVEAYMQDSLVGGTRESIRAYLTGLYHDPPEGVAPPSYLLIVGDVEHVPLSRYPGQVTDLYYAEYDGEGDYLPDLFYGRISVSDTSQLAGVADKILEYEQYLFPDPSFLDRSVLIAGMDGGYASTHGNGQINYARDNYLTSSSGQMAHVFAYPESGSAAREILDLVSGGVGFVNYTGHGEYDRWLDPAFRVQDIDSLENTGKFPIMIGNGCETNRFSAGTCFAEALLRAPGKGALAYIGCTNDSYWDEDFFWSVGVGPISAHPSYEESTTGFYDRVFHTRGEPYTLWTPSLGEMVFGGNMAVQGSGSSLKRFYWEIYQLAGDPTIVPWFWQPDLQEVTYPGSLPPGSDRVDVACAPNSYVALSKDGLLLDALHASSGGYATLTVPDSIVAGTMDLVVSGDRFAPWSGKVVLGEPSPVYLELLGYALSRESIEWDRVITPGEQVSLDIRLLHLGNQRIDQDTLLLFSGNGAIQVTDSLCPVHEVDPGDTLDLRGVFRLRAPGSLEDRSEADLGTRLKGGGNCFYIREKLHGPVLVPGNICWEDRPFGNGNGMAETGEWLQCNWTLFNSGHYRTGEISGACVQGDSARIEVEFLNHPVIDAGDSLLLQFRFRILDQPRGWSAPVTFLAGDSSGTVTASLGVGLDQYFEDFSPGWSTRFPFGNDSVRPWESTGDRYTSPGFSLRSGTISHNGISRLNLAIETGERDTLSFAYRVSSEYNYDFLELYLDSVLVKRWSGYIDWKSYALVLEEGKHLVTWNYRKDESENRGEDAAWIDDLVLPDAVLWSGDLALMEILAPASGPWLGSEEQVGIRVRNPSTDTVTGFQALLRINDDLLAMHTWSGTVAPGGEVVTYPGEVADLSGIGSYLIEACLISDTSGLPGNDGLEKRVDHYPYPELSMSLEELVQLDGVFADAVLRLENGGNIPLDSFQYEVWLGERLASSGSSHPLLAPGDSRTESFRLTDSLQFLHPGDYRYRIMALLQDSVPGTNMVTGILEWKALGISGHGGQVAWTVIPNPSSGGFRVLLPRGSDVEMIFRLYTAGGRLLGHYTLPAGSSQLYIPAAGLPGGMYLLEERRNGTMVRLVVTR